MLHHPPSPAPILSLSSCTFPSLPARHPLPPLPPSPPPLPAALTCARARLQDGQAILELGCGWGSLTLFMAQAYRNATITAVSNSTTQREFIMRRARDLELHNVQVLTADMVDFQVNLCKGPQLGGGGGIDSLL